MKGETSSVRVARCPKCGNVYSDRPALSRDNGVGYICPDCGTREALASLGCSLEEQERILDLIHESVRRKTEND